MELTERRRVQDGRTVDVMRGGEHTVSVGRGPVGRAVVADELDRLGLRIGRGRRRDRERCGDTEPRTSNDDPPHAGGSFVAPEAAAVTRWRKGGRVGEWAEVGR